MAPRYEEIMKTKPYLPFDMGGKLTEAMMAKAKEELGETEEVKAKTIPQLRQLIEEEPGLVCPTDDAYLLQYLRPRKFNVKRAFSMLKNYYEVKRSNGDLYDKYDEEGLRRAMDMKSSYFLPYRDEDGCAIAVFRLRAWDVDEVSAAEIMIAMTAMLLLGNREPATQICGVRLLFDTKGFNLKHVRSLIPRYAYLFSRALQNCLPLRFTSIHFFNESNIFHYLASFIRFFTTEKINSRMHFHGGNLKYLHKCIPRDILPVKDYGGENPNDIVEWFNSEIEKQLEFYRLFTTYGYRQ